MPFKKGTVIISSDGKIGKGDNMGDSGSNGVNMRSNFTPVSRVKSSIRVILMKNLILILLILSLLVGIALGAILRSQIRDFTARQIMFLRFPGELLLRMLKCLVIPLIVSSLISGVAALDNKSSGRLGLFSLIYYISTTFLAVILGIVLVLSIRPGIGARTDVTLEATENNQIAESFIDLLRNMFPDNIFEATFRMSNTKYEKRHFDRIVRINDSFCNSLNETLHVQHPNCSRTIIETKELVIISKENGVNALGLVFYSLTLGLVLGAMGDLGKPIVDFCTCMSEATMKMIIYVIWYSPIGIVFLICAEILSMKDPLSDLIALGWYMLVVLIGLVVHGAVTLPALYFLVLRQNPYKKLLPVSQAFLTAFGTSSSSATLPVTYYCLEQKLGVDPRVTRFVLPVGATINMDGTALYEAVAAIYIAQLNNISLNIAQVIAVSITSTLASIGAASVPQAGLVTMVIVLSAIGLPADEVAKILAVDWLLDRFRTMINVEGDVIGCFIINHLCRHQLTPPTSSTNVVVVENVQSPPKKFAEETEDVYI